MPVVLVTAIHRIASARFANGAFRSAIRLLYTFTVAPPVMLIPFTPAAVEIPAAAEFLPRPPA